MTGYFVDYTDEQLPQLQNWIMQWWQADTAGINTLCHAGDVPHRIYNGNRGRFNRSDLVKSFYLNEDCVGGFILVHPKYSGFDVFINPTLSIKERTISMKTLVEKAYAICRPLMDELGKQDKPVMTDVIESDSFRRTILSEMGFKQDSHWLNETLRDLNEPIPQPELPEGFSIRAATMDDFEQLAAVHSGAFGSNWTGEEYLREVMQKPGYSPENELVVVAPDGRFAAFVVTWFDELNKVGLFEPVGAHSDFQRKGLTRSLMNHTLQVMKDKGMKKAEVCHGIDNPASTGLYAAVGFKLWNRVFSWEK